ncbi:MAG: hypothetical protein M1818_002334 [Claussenomyces sp. TS43310]|nr:MAG: hypothetical protein M1818_002334 [Claussenomyces sp. TS43310]
MADDNNSQDALITEFCGLTGASPQEAQQFLEVNRWDLSSAAAEFYTSQEEGIAGVREDDTMEVEPDVPADYTGPRTLDGRPAPTSAIPSVGSSSRSSKKEPARRGVATLGSLSQQDEGHAHSHDDEDSEDETGQPRDLFAGGEKSGLAVQDPRGPRDPRKIVNELIKKAQANTPRPAGPSAEAPPSRFRGSGMTLGGDDTPSQVVLDPHANVPRSTPPVTRVLHLWADGFSIEDGPLHRFDDPQNAADLHVIRSGRAPLHLMNVAPDQEVDVQLHKHEENYVAPKKVYKPFSGGGQRLGSPTPGAPSTSASTTAPIPAPAAAAPAASTSVAQDVDPSQPTLSLRVQLADGTRLPARFNTTHTIGDVYSFIDRASPGSTTRPWVLATTFPNKEHTDKSAVLGDLPEFKRGGTAVQKWL